MEEIGLWCFLAEEIIFRRRASGPKNPLPIPKDFTGCLLKWYPGVWDANLFRPASYRDDKGRPYLKYRMGYGPKHKYGVYYPVEQYKDGVLVGHWADFNEPRYEAFSNSRICEWFYINHYHPKPCEKYPYGWAWDSRIHTMVPVQQDPFEIAAPRPLEAPPKSEAHGNSNSMTYGQLNAMGAVHAMPEDC